MFKFFKIKKYFESGNVYLLQGSSFPEPLTDSEERFYLRKMHEGDEDAKNILIETIDELRKSKYFDGYKTLNMIC